MCAFNETLLFFFWNWQAHLLLQFWWEFVGLLMYLVSVSFKCSYCSFHSCLLIPSFAHAPSSCKLLGTLSSFKFEFGIAEWFVELPSTCLANWSDSRNCHTGSVNPLSCMCQSFLWEYFKRDIAALVFTAFTILSMHKYNSLCCHQ